ncbi:methylenetetrahydrofolate reductase [Candidatus Tremblaya phenacola]|uniref:methylenetetrahydrofolate reductase n=1 Tax=Candidatus Tremblayella phenacoccinincola TaxID=1010676 RepID=UPI00132FBEFF|nr:methylenetetrahydrofolate reductase [Candidatus Tremblaya phenacola]KAH0998325.1 5,10-methylenetetrahydrofolate reductase [Candidatus Tremblaya phenacola]
MKNLPNISFEFSPPKTYYGFLKLLQVQRELACVLPKFVSITYSRSSFKRNQLDLIVSMRRFFNSVVPHMLCSSPKQELLKELSFYKEVGIRHIIVLKGDTPGLKEDSFSTDASDLVRLIRCEYGEFFYIDVAAYPEGHPGNPSILKDIKSFVRKVESGADSAITQYFYNVDSYYKLLEDVYKLGVKTPITPGIMPIISYEKLLYFSELCGADIPYWIIKRLKALKDRNCSVLEFGVEVILKLCESLISLGVSDLHIYTLNECSIVKAICKHLGCIQT